jgi:bifunctional DNA-binding transcriptional regulator/antitoxin component of YhaV-PrlF toxin-antitoxin module
MSKQYVYKVEDIFEDIPDDPKNVNMTIPPEIMEQIGITTGDTVKISYGDQGSLIIEKVDKKENSGEENKKEQE